MDRWPDLRQDCVDELFALAEDAFSLLHDGDGRRARLLLRVEAAATVGARRLADADGEDGARLARPFAALLAEAARELRATTAAVTLLAEQIERSVSLLRELSPPPPDPPA